VNDARAETYLTLPPGYAGRVGGLRWAVGGDAVERWNGTTLALTEEIGAVLEGVFTRPPVPPFVVVLHVLHLLRSDDSSALSVRLRRAFEDAAGAAGLFRNAGVLIAELCAGVPPAAATPEWPAVDAARARRLRSGPVVFPLLAEDPALSPPEVEARVADRLATLTDDALRHWLTAGCAPGTAGAKVAEVVESFPARVARLLALARRRPRLVGAAAVVPAVDAALTLPPRRRSPDAVPQGGYCDVTTRGDPDRLLPSQFALDPDEFVRRFAERELLYFQREEPQAAEKPDRLIVLDQGVRTWGSVRLALAAAAVVLLRKDARRLGRLFLAATSADAVLDVAAADPEKLADLLEASDLTADPAACWENALASPGEAPRDVILLTHPRTARAPALHAVPRRSGDRVFALTVDDHGTAELAEWGPVGPVPLRAFKVDLDAAEAARPDQDAGSAAQLRTSWAGDVEPVGFPFRPGVVGEVLTFGFDAAGEWLVIAGPQGTLHGLMFDGGPPEVLPRAFHDGAVLKQVDAVLGLAGGVAVCGRLTLTRPTQVDMTASPPGTPVVSSTASDDPPLRPKAAFAVAYYDRVTRRVAVHQLGEASPTAQWGAFPDLNCVAVRPTPENDRFPAAVDLSTGHRFPRPSPERQSKRCIEAIKRTSQGGSPPFSLSVLTVPLPTPQPTGGGDGPYLFVKGNTIRVWYSVPEWPAFEPLRDGKPFLGGTYIQRAQLAGDVLALALKREGRQSIVFFQRPDGRVIGEVPLPDGQPLFALSWDGRLVARVKPARTVVVSRTAGGDPLTLAPPAGLHNNLDVRVAAAPFRLTLQVGGHEHQFAVVEGGPLFHRYTGGVPERRHVDGGVWPRAARHAPQRASPRYDPVRFPPQAGDRDGPWSAVLDRLGQVLLFASGEEPVAAFLVRRELAAVWTPEGEFWGDAALIGGPPTPGAAQRIGRAISAAGKG
jgi:hypothetical protein